MSIRPTAEHEVHSSKKAFTLIELLVVIGIIALLISILLPSLSKAREQSKKMVCASNLAGFGKGFYLYANNNGDYLCSGSFDPQVSEGRDGPVNKVGWVADLVNSKYAEPAKQLCPSNPAMYNQKLRSNGAGTDSYDEEEARDLIQRGYNSNYTQSWYMARTQSRPVARRSARQELNMRRVDSTLGALRTGAMTRVAPSKVPLLGDGRTDDDENLFGERCVKTLTDGPFGGPYGLQNFADFGPAHGIASWISRDKGHNRIFANVLFGDAHVGVFQDSDRDGEFAIDADRFPAEQKDLNPNQVFDGVLTLGRRSESLWSLK